MDEDEPLTFREMLLLAIAPPVLAAVVEHIVAPLLGHALTAEPPKSKARSKARAKAAARGFSAYVAHERGRP